VGKHFARFEILTPVSINITVLVVLGSIVVVLVDIYLLENVNLYRTVRSHVQNTAIFNLKCDVVALNVVMW
jgi:hypothetical protein